MFVIPEASTPELQAFIAGFVLPFIATSLGYAVAVVRSLLHRVDSAN